MKIVPNPPRVSELGRAPCLYDVAYRDEGERVDENLVIWDGAEWLSASELWNTKFNVQVNVNEQQCPD